MDDWKQARGAFWGLALPVWVWGLAFFIVPLGLIWLFSFSAKEGVTGIVLVWNFDNYARAFDTIYLQVFWKSISIAALATLICLLFGYPVAMAIAFAPQRIKPLLLLIVVLPVWVNILIRTYALIAVFRTRGFVNFTLEWLWDKADAALGLVGLGGLIGEFTPLVLLYNNAAVTIGIVYGYLPFMILPLYANLERFNRTYLEASLDLGAGHIRSFFTILIPLTLPGIISGIIIVFIPAMGAFFIADMLGGTDSQLIGNVIERQFKSANNWPFGAALSFLLMYLTFAAIALRAWLAGRAHVKQQAEE